jgi:hypothetical protein
VAWSGERKEHSTVVCIVNINESPERDTQEEHSEAYKHTYFGLECRYIWRALCERDDLHT